MKYLGYIIDVIGIVTLIIGLYFFIKAKKQVKIENKRKRDKLEKPYVVVIGGGTGQSIFLRGLKKITPNITAVVTVADDGGGSGVLRSDLGMLPPGDIRNCLLALANTEPTMQEVMQYRFEEGGLKGQSFGNLFLAAMNGLYGNFETAVYKLSEIFNITGRVLPVTLESIDLMAKLNNGNIIKGESKIPRQVRKQKSKIEEVYLEPKDAKPLDEVIMLFKGINKDTQNVDERFFEVKEKYFVNKTITDEINENGKYKSRILFPFGENKYNDLDVFKYWFFFGRVIWHCSHITLLNCLFS